jgi:hypothetical protein
VEWSVLAPFFKGGNNSSAAGRLSRVDTDTGKIKTASTSRTYVENVRVRQVHRAEQVVSGDIANGRITRTKS